VAFDGSNHLEFDDFAGAINPANYNDQMSISFWLAIDDLSMNQGIFEMVNSIGEGLRLHYEGGGNLILTINESEVAQLTGYQTIAQPGEWKLVTIIISGMNVDLIIDEDHRINEPLMNYIYFSNENPIYLGQSPRSGVANLQGKIDDFRIYSFTLYDEMSPGIPDDISLRFNQGGWPAPQITMIDIEPFGFNFDFNFSNRPDFLDRWAYIEEETSPGNFTLVAEFPYGSMLGYGSATPGKKYRVSTWEQNSTNDRISLISEFEFYTPPNDALMAHWAFEPGSEIIDNVFSGNNLINLDDPFTIEPNRFGAPNGAIGYTGTVRQQASSPPILPNPNLDIFNTGISWSFWIWTDTDAPTDNGVILSYDTGGTDGTYFKIANQGLIFGHNDDVRTVPMDPAQYSREWTHVVVTWDTANAGSDPIQITLNGNETFNPSALEFVSKNYGDFFLGHATADSFFVGNLDDLRIFHKVLSSSEIQSLYHERKLTSLRVTAVEP
jgi:hypothetical protein